MKNINTKVSKQAGRTPKQKSLQQNEKVAEASRKPLITGFKEPLRRQVCDNVIKLATKSCFQSVNEIQKLRGHELEEIHIKKPPESDRKPFVLTVA